jgi:hypothetical protein
VKNITKAKLYVALSVKKAKLYLQVIKTSFLLAKGKFLLAKRKLYVPLSVNKALLYLQVIKTFSRKT